MAKRARQVYWKPKYGTRVTRERAWARRSAAREEALQGRSRHRSVAAWLRALFPPRTP